MKTIVLVDDNEGDVELIQSYLEERDERLSFTWLRDGEEAIAWLQGAAPRPWLMLLDLNLPKYDGAEVLRMVRSSPVHRALPVVVLSSSVADRDLRRAYEGGANAYIVKAPTLGQFRRTMAALVELFLEVAVQPSA